MSGFYHALNWLQAKKPTSSKTPLEPTQMEGTIFIAVVGSTGSGKSSLIARITGNDEAVVGHGLDSQTSEVTAHATVVDGKRFVLIDSPGFDDTYRSASDIALQVTTWLVDSYRSGTRLHGVLFLHPIDRPRMTGSSLETLRMLRKLCGPEGFGNITLVTTMWDKIKDQEGIAREGELIRNPDFWGSMIRKGARTARTSRREPHPEQLVLDISATNRPFTMLAQDEVVNQGKDIKDTSAVQTEVDEETKRMEQKLREQQQSQAEELRRRQEDDRRRVEEQRRQQEAALRQRQARERAEREAYERAAREAEEMRRRQREEREQRAREHAERLEQQRLERQRQQEEMQEAERTRAVIEDFERIRRDLLNHLWKLQSLPGWQFSPPHSMAVAQLTNSLEGLDRSMRDWLSRR